MLRFFLKPIVFCLFIIPGLSTVTFSKTLLVSQIPGEGVFSSISGASAQAGAGDTLFVEEGVYHERVVLKNGVTIQGAGTGLTRIEYSGKGPVVYGKNIKDGALENLSLTYRGEEKKSIIYLVSSTVAINQVVLFGGSLSGVEARGDSRVEIKGAVVKGNKGSGIFLYKGAKGYVEDSQIVGNRYFGIEVKSGALLSARNILVNENQAGGVNLMKDASLELHGSQIFENANYGVLINKGSSGKIVNNNILGNSRAGILVFSGGVSVIQNNIISYNGTGIRIHGEQLPFLSHNNVWNNGLAYENMKKPETDISLDPMFDSSYRLKRGSPMIGKGFWGQDIGAFPFDGGAAPVEPPSEKASPVIAREKREARPEGAVSTGKDGCVEASTFYNKGVARQDFSQAEIDFYKKAISLCKDHYKSHFNLGVVYKKLKRYSEAKAEFKEVIRIKNDLADAHYNLGEIYDTLNDLGFAIEEYRETIRFDPNKLNAHYNLAGIFASLKQYDRAKGALEESLRIDPSHTPSLVLLKKVDKNLKTRKNE